MFVSQFKEILVKENLVEEFNDNTCRREFNRRRIFEEVVI